MSKEVLDRLEYLISKKKSVIEIAKIMEVEPYVVYGLVQELINQGKLYNIVDGEILKLKAPPKIDDVYKIPNTTEHQKLLLLSDTHLCSKYDRLDILRYIYDKAESNGVNIALHCGDFTDGRSNRPEQVYELKELSYEGQKDYCIEKYPAFSGKTYVISGNHDDWWYKLSGSDIVKAICKEREDLVYLGPDVADMKIGKLKIHMFHGKGSVSYAKSYKAQKYLDSMSMERRPDILQLGHIHQAFYYLQDHTHVLQTGCLQDPTPFVRSMGLEGARSCWWVDVDYDDKGNVYKITPELETFGPKLIKRR